MFEGRGTEQIPKLWEKMSLFCPVSLQCRMYRVIRPPARATNRGDFCHSHEAGGKDDEHQSLEWPLKCLLSMQTGKDARLDGVFPKDDSEPFITGESM